MHCYLWPISNSEFCYFFSFLLNVNAQSKRCKSSNDAFRRVTSAAPLPSPTKIPPSLSVPFTRTLTHRKRLFGLPPWRRYLKIGQSCVMHDDVIRKKADYLKEKNVRSRTWKTHDERRSNKYKEGRVGVGDTEARGVRLSTHSRMYSTAPPSSRNGTN